MIIYIYLFKEVLFYPFTFKTVCYNLVTMLQMYWFIKTEFLFIENNNWFCLVPYTMYTENLSLGISSSQSKPAGHKTCIKT
jgi:hypothetical protein